MKYEVVDRGGRLEAYGAHSGYRVRMSTSRLACLDSSCPVLVYVRGSESEDEVRVPVPRRELSTVTEAFDYGYECAERWIDEQDSDAG